MLLIARPKAVKELVIKASFFAALFLYPLVFLWAFFFEIPTVLGVNSGILLVLFLISSSAFLSGLHIDRNLLLLTLSALALAILAFATRLFFLNEISSFRYLLMPIFYIIVASAICRRIEPSFVVSTILFVVLLQSVIGLVHSHFFPNIVIGYDLNNDGTLIHILSSDEGGFRENGTLLGPNVFANFLVIGLGLLTYILPRVSNFKFRLMMTLSGLLLASAIFLSGSRLGIGFSVLFLASMCAQLLITFRNKWFAIMSGMILIPLFVLWIPRVFSHVVNRTVSEGSGDRLEKLELSLSLLQTNFESVLFGVSTAEVASARSLSGVTISDNSFTLLWLDNGLIAAVFFPLIFLVAILRSLPTSARPVWALYFLAALFFNNAVLWDIWWCFLLFSACALGRLGANKGGVSNAGLSHNANI